MTRILIRQPLETNGMVTVTGNEHHYLTRVRRHRPGDTITVTNEAGRQYEATVDTIDADAALLRIGKETEGAAVHPVTLIVALPKRNLMDDIVRMTSELGVTRIRPAIAGRTVANPSPERVSRWRRLASESQRQCGRAHPIVIDDPTPLETCLRETDAAQHRILLHPTADRAFVSAVTETEAPLTIAIGPEGGFTEDELTRAARHGFVSARLDTPILRIETAAIAAAAIAVSRPTSRYP